MSGVVVDTSVWIDFFAGKRIPSLEEALAAGAVVLPPVVVAELVGGARRESQRAQVVELVRDLTVHGTPVEHWIRVAHLRQALARSGIAVSTPDAHVAQCALDLDAVLLSRDRVFAKIAEAAPLRLASL